MVGQSYSMHYLSLLSLWVWLLSVGPFWASLALYTILVWYESLNIVLNDTKSTGQPRIIWKLPFFNKEIAHCDWTSWLVMQPVVLFAAPCFLASVMCVTSSNHHIYSTLWCCFVIGGLLFPSLLQTSTVLIFIMNHCCRPCRDRIVLQVSYLYRGIMCATWLFWYSTFFHQCMQVVIISHVSSCKLQYKLAVSYQYFCCISCTLYCLLN